MRKNTTRSAFLPRQSAMEVDAEREQAVKEAIDAVAYRLGFFRDYDEPNESFLGRLDAYLRQLTRALNEERTA